MKTTMNGIVEKVPATEEVETTETEIPNPYIGSSFDDFLKEEGIYYEAHAGAIKEILAWQLEQAMKEKGLTKSEMAKLMNTSRSSLNRLLDSNNESVTLQTLIKAAAIVGRTLKIELV